MHLWFLEPFGKISKLAINKLVRVGGEIISNDVDNMVYEAKTSTSQHKHVKAWPRPKFVIP